MNIADSHSYIQDILKKTQSGAVSSVIIDRMLERAQMAEFATKKAAFIETGFIHQSLAPFQEDFQFTTGQDGRISCPTDYLHPTGSYAIQWNNGTQQVQYGSLPVLLQDQLADRLGSHLLPVNNNNAILYIAGKRLLQVRPTAMVTGTIHYLRKPVAPKYNFTLVGRQQVYNPVGSQDLEWEDDYVNVILDGALVLLGVNLNAPGIVQWAGQQVVNNLGGVKA